MTWYEMLIFFKGFLIVILIIFQWYKHVNMWETLMFLMFLAVYGKVHVFVCYGVFLLWMVEQTDTLKCIFNA